MSLQRPSQRTGLTETIYSSPIPLKVSTTTSGSKPVKNVTCSCLPSVFSLSIYFGILNVFSYSGKSPLYYKTYFRFQTSRFLINITKYPAQQLNSGKCCGSEKCSDLLRIWNKMMQSFQDDSSCQIQ